MRDGATADAHVFRFEPRYPVESQILGELLRPGMRVLDVGTAATGRSARLLRELGADVVSIEINEAAIQEFARRDDSAGICLAAADLCHLPFVDGAFDLVLVAFHGLDYLPTAALRRRAFREVGRVLRRPGALVFNSFNRLGILLSPSGLRTKSSLALRLRHIVTGRFLRPTLVDINRLELHQALPQTIIRRVEEETDLRFAFATNLSGRSRNLAVVTLFSAAPYYVFRR